MQTCIPVEWHFFGKKLFLLSFVRLSSELTVKHTWLIRIGYNPIANLPAFNERYDSEDLLHNGVIMLRDKNTQSISTYIMSGQLIAHRSVETSIHVGY
jgi:hypothetical protein